MNQRIKKLRKSFEKEKIDGLLVTEPLNIRYLTGFMGLSPKEREAYVLVTKDKCFLITDGRYIDQAKKIQRQRHSGSGQRTLPEWREEKVDPIKVIEIKPKENIVKLLNGLVVKLKIKRLGFEKNDLKFGEYEKLIKKLKNVRLVPTKDLVENLRVIKEPKEIEKIKKAFLISYKCFENLLKFIKPGLTEKQVAWEIEKFIKENGAEISFPPIVARGPNSAIPHHVANNKKQITDNSILLLDFGAKVDGYCSDMTRVVFLGKATKEQKKAYHAVLNAQTKALKALAAHSNTPVYRSKRKLKTKSIDKIAREFLKKSGLDEIPHGLGHGVGLSEHEIPRLSPKSKDTLSPRMVFTIEPGVYLKGKFGIRIEDLVLLKTGKVEVLTKSSKEIIEL